MIGDRCMHIHQWLTVQPWSSAQCKSVEVYESAQTVGIHLMVVVHVINGNYKVALHILNAPLPLPLSLSLSLFQGSESSILDLHQGMYL